MEKLDEDLVAIRDRWLAEDPSDDPWGIVANLLVEVQERRDECQRLQQLLTAAAFKSPATGAQIKAFLRGQEIPPAFDAGAGGKA